MKSTEVVEIVNGYFKINPPKPEDRFDICIAKKGQNLRHDCWPQFKYELVLDHCKKYIASSSFTKDCEFWIENVKDRTVKSPRFSFDDPDTVRKSFELYENKEKDKASFKIIQDFLNQNKNLYVKVYQNGNYSWLITTSGLVELLNNMLSMRGTILNLHLQGGDAGSPNYINSETFDLFGNKIDFSILENKESKENKMKEISKQAVGMINDFLKKSQVASPSLIKGYKNGIHTWNWNINDFKQKISVLQTSGLVNAADAIQIEVAGSTQGVSSRFFVTEKLDFSEEIVLEKEKKMSSTKSIAKASSIDSFNHFKEGGKTRLVHKMGGNLVTAISSLIPSDEVKTLFENEHIKTGTQGVLSFFIKVLCEEGVIPQHARPFVKKACERQLEAAGFELSGPVMEQVAPFVQLMMGQLVEAGKSLMTAEEIEAAEKEIRETEIAKARVEEEVDISIEEEEEELSLQKKSISA